MNCKTKSFITKRKAFTLIELLIVIAIIGILFIVLISKVDFATDKAKATGVQTDFRSFQVAIESVAKENAGFNTFGWDTGDTNGDRIRNSYDKGDINQNGKQDPGEVFIGSKTYGETWTNVYTLTNPSDANDKSAIVALEEAINKNLDPKLHITIHDDLTITMANGAQDPWDTEYHGYYITNATTDNKDRGAIIMYSNGANQEFGSEHSIANGVVTVNVPGNNVYGKDDYSVSTIYTYVNGYGEVKTTTSGFSNNQTTQDNTSNNSGTEGTEDPGVTELLEPGLYATGAIALVEAGDIEAAKDMIKTSWDDLLAAGIVHVTNGAVYSNFDWDTWENASSDALDGDLVLPNDGSITSIGDFLYDEYYDDFIGNIAFASCYKLTGIYIPTGVTSISGQAFSNCRNLTSITISDSITSIVDYAFAGCTGLTDFIIPESVDYVGYAIFTGCSSLESLTIPFTGSQREFDDAEDPCRLFGYIFGTEYYDGSREAWHMWTTQTIQQIVCYIPESLTTVVFTGNKIHSFAFNDCEFENLIIENDVESIGLAAFFQAKITNLTLGTGLKFTDEAAFYGTEIENLYLTDMNKFWNVSWGPNCGHPTSWGKVNLYLNNQLVTDYTFANDLTEIPAGALSRFISIVSVTIPKNITHIGESAFQDCTNLTSVTIQNGVTSIGYRAFYECTSLTSITIPDSVTTIGQLAFADCENLTSITIPDSVTSIGEQAFFYCKSLTNITFNGTKEEWSSIEKQSNWNSYVPATYVQCTDGTITLK